MIILHGTLSHCALEVYILALTVSNWTKLHLICYKGNNLKNNHARVMVLVHYTSSE